MLYKPSMLKLIRNALAKRRAKLDASRNREPRPRAETRRRELAIRLASRFSDRRDDSDLRLQADRPMLPCIDVCGLGRKQGWAVNSDLSANPDSFVAQVRNLDLAGSA